MKGKYVECSCHAAEHTMRFMYFEDEADFMYMGHYLHSSTNFFKRLWWGLKYIFGSKQGMGCFDETIIDRSRATEIIHLMDQFIVDNDKYLEKKRSK